MMTTGSSHLDFLLYLNSFSKISSVQDIPQIAEHTATEHGSQKKNIRETSIHYNCFRYQKKKNQLD
jgi:hypothetical protein